MMFGAKQLTILWVDPLPFEKGFEILQNIENRATLNPTQTCQTC